MKKNTVVNIWSKWFSKLIFIFDKFKINTKKKDKNIAIIQKKPNTFSERYKNHPYLMYSGSNLTNSITNKGIRLEMQLCTPLRALIPDENIIPNLYLPWGNNKYSQIDVLIVDNYGIYVIESKNYKGAVVGKENDEDWIHSTEKSTNIFQNPIKQNKGHILTLKKHLPYIAEKNMYSIIVFNNLCNLQISVTSYVICKSELLSTIRRI